MRTSGSVGVVGTPQREQTEAGSRLAALRQDLAALGNTPKCHAGPPANPSSRVLRTPSDKICLFRSLFRGRADVFATQFVSRRTGKPEYAK